MLKRLGVKDRLGVRAVQMNCLQKRALRAEYELAT